MEEYVMARGGDATDGPGTRPGRLKVFLGAAPGVGKTYRMLDEGRRRAARGTHVVVAFAECHGRASTEAMLDGLDVLPRVTRRHRGTDFAEVDLDRVLELRPQVVLIDELAHTNAPGDRNAKRWQDVEDLLGAGIDVVATLNIQHLDSLSDVVEKITGVPQHETVPDEFARSNRPTSSTCAVRIPLGNRPGCSSAHRAADTVESVGRGHRIEEVPDVRRLDVGGGVVSVERVVGVLVAAALVGLLVLVVKFPDRF